MRAVVMRAGQLVVEDVAMPAPGPGEVLVRSLACGVCGTDLHALSHAEELVDSSRRIGGGFAAGMDAAADVVLGHEFCAEVVEFGPGTRGRLAVGTAVCSMPVLPTRTPPQVVGFSNIVPGGLAEYMVLAEAQLIPVPAGVAPMHAALTEPLAVGVHAVELARLEPEDQPLVVGCGPVGLAVIAALAQRGAGPIVAADFSPRRRDLAEAIGADVVIDPGTVSPYETWREVARSGPDPSEPYLRLGQALGRRRAVVFECVGVPGMIQAILAGVPRGARIVVVGVCMGLDHFEPLFGVNKELSLQFAFAYTSTEFAATLRNIGEGRVPVELLVTGTISLDEVSTAFAQMTSPAAAHAKIVVDPARLIT